jgi:signal transduction histidine kinase
MNDRVDVAADAAESFSLNRRAIDLSALVRRAAAAMRSVADRHGVLISLDVPPELPRLDADRERLEDVLGNVIANAIEFTPPGGYIVIGAHAHGAEAFVWIKDTGMGIPAAQLPRLFDEFWHGNGDHRMRLSGCKAIIEAHAGRIWIDSAVGRGTTVFFALPLAPRSAANRS